MAKALKPTERLLAGTMFEHIMLTEHQARYLVEVTGHSWDGEHRTYGYTQISEIARVVTNLKGRSRMVFTAPPDRDSLNHLRTLLPQSLCDRLPDPVQTASELTPEAAREMARHHEEVIGQAS